MALYATAALVKAQALLIKRFQSGELRFRIPAVHNLFVSNRDIMTPNYKDLRTREDRTVETNYFLRSSRALGAGRSHNHTGAIGDSGLLTPAWTTYNDEFASTLKQADNKVYSETQILANEMENAIGNFAEGLDTVASGVLFAARSGVNVSTADGTFDAVDDVFEITEATNGERAVQITQTNLDINKWQNVPLTYVCDSIAWGKFGFDMAQGSANSTNTSFQFNSLITFVHDPSLTAAAAGLVSAYADGFWLVVPQGTIAGLDWIPRQNMQGVDEGAAIGTYGSIMNPVDALMYAMHIYKNRVDGTADGGYTQDVKTQTEISLDMAYEIAPLSVANETPVQAFGFV